MTPTEELILVNQARILAVLAALLQTARPRDGKEAIATYEGAKLTLAQIAKWKQRG